MKRWVDEDGVVHDADSCGCGACTSFDSYEAWFARMGWLVDVPPGRALCCNLHYRHGGACGRKLTRSETMSRIRSRGTRPEEEFRRLHPEAEVHPDWLPLHPDFLLAGRVWYVDSGFWHLDGVRAVKFALMSEFWQLKLLRNYCRDLARDSFYGELGEVVDAGSLI